MSDGQLMTTEGMCGEAHNRHSISHSVHLGTTSTIRPVAPG